MKPKLLLRSRPLIKARSSRNVLMCSLKKVLTGSAVAILQISVRKCSCWLDRDVQRDVPAAHMRRVPPLAGCFSATPPPLLQTKAWRAPRPGGSVRQRAAAEMPSFSVPHVSSLAFKAPFSVHRYCCFVLLVWCIYGLEPGTWGPVSSRGC